MWIAIAFICGAICGGVGVYLHLAEILHQVEDLDLFLDERGLL